MPARGAIAPASRARQRRFACLTAATWFAACIGPAVGAAVESVAESSVKAAFLYKFPVYVEWPHSPQAGTVEIGVIGNEAVHAALEEITAGRASDERAIRVRPIHDPASLNGLHVLFIGDGAAGASKEYLMAAHSRSILTVTDHAASGQRGIIDFVLVDGRVRFTISQSVAQRAGLKISSRLLAVAQDVREGDAE